MAGGDTGDRTGRTRATDAGGEGALGRPEPPIDSADEPTRVVHEVDPSGVETVLVEREDPALTDTVVIEESDDGGGTPPVYGADAGVDVDAARPPDPPDPEATSETPPAAAASQPRGPGATVYGDEPESGRPTLGPGVVLFGEYEIVDVLGAGGMGEVYRARHRRLDETRAIKVMHPAVAQDPTAADFFDREAKALISVRHPAVVHCHDLLSDDSGCVYLVMEMIDGISLADCIRNEPLSVEEVRTLGARVASGLAAAHARGVIHRDLSPDNIVLPGGRVEEAKLIDFGIAKVLASGQQTILEGFKGKLAFASPEQLGFFGGDIDGRSDLYSLGLVLYAAATGHLLPMGTSVADAVDSRRGLTALPDDCPAVLRRELEPLLALHPDGRPASAAGLFAEPAPRDRAPERSRLTPILAAGAVVVAIAGAGWWLWPAADPEPEVGPLPPLEQAVVEPALPVVAPAPAPPVVEPAPGPVPEPKPQPPRRDPAEVARSRLRIVGLLRGAESALVRGQLTSPPAPTPTRSIRRCSRSTAGTRRRRPACRKWPAVTSSWRTRRSCAAPWRRRKLTSRRPAASRVATPISPRRARR